MNDMRISQPSTSDGLCSCCGELCNQESSMDMKVGTDPVIEVRICSVCWDYGWRHSRSTIYAEDLAREFNQDLMQVRQDFQGLRYDQLLAHLRFSELVMMVAQEEIWLRSEARWDG